MVKVAAHLPIPDALEEVVEGTRVAAWEITRWPVGVARGECIDEGFPGAGGVVARPPLGWDDCVALPLPRKSMCSALAGAC